MFGLPKGLDGGLDESIVVVLFHNLIIGLLQRYEILYDKQSRICYFLPFRGVLNLVVAHKSTPVRKIGDVLRALLDCAYDVANESRFRVVPFQRTDIIIQPAETLPSAILADNIATDSFSATDSFTQFSFFLT